MFLERTMMDKKIKPLKRGVFIITASVLALCLGNQVG